MLRSASSSGKSSSPLLHDMFTFSRANVYASFLSDGSSKLTLKISVFPSRTAPISSVAIYEMVPSAGSKFRFLSSPLPKFIALYVFTVRVVSCVIMKPSDVRFAFPAISTYTLTPIRFSLS